MGIEIEVNSLEELCDLMCDNIIPEKEDDQEEEKRGAPEHSQSSTPNTM